MATQGSSLKYLKQLQRTYSCISGETLEELSHRGLLHFDGTKWRFGDNDNGTTRRIDGRKFTLRDGQQVKAFGDNKEAAWHQLIGLRDVIDNDRPYALLAIEGSKDALAAAEFAFRRGVLSETGIMCALGSGYRPLPNEMHKLAGRWVVLIGDNDQVGTETTQLVSFSLNTAGVGHCVWDWGLCEIKAKDLFAFMTKVPAGRMKNPFVQLYSGTFFCPPPPSYDSTVQQFNSSTQEITTSLSDIIGVTIEEFVAPYIVTKKGTSDGKSFDLARAIKSTNPNTTMNEIIMIYEEWFAKSQAHLPKGTSKDESFKTFMRQLTRVRFTDSGLQAAIERARKMRLPFVPALDGNDEATRLAALCRELQREAGKGRAFICPVNIAQRFLNLRWPEQARWLLHQLERNEVIECVDLGAPNTRGKKGKSTLWRYKLPLDQ
jgi:hypothetical protein